MFIVGGTPLLLGSVKPSLFYVAVSVIVWPLFGLLWAAGNWAASERLFLKAAQQLAQRDVPASGRSAR
jgi:hypothetical protein